MEKNAYETLKHPNILQMKESLIFKKIDQIGQTTDVNALVLEFAEKKELFDYVEQIGPFTEPIAKKIFRQIVTGVDHIHQNGYAHLDLKLENIFVDGNYLLKIADFDLCRPLSKIPAQPGGSEPYKAPEITIFMISREPHNGPELDVFALGVMLFVICTGNPPFTKADPFRDRFYHKFERDSDNFWKAHEKGGEKLSDDLKKLIMGCCARNPKDRLTIPGILESAWLATEEISLDSYYKEFDKRFAQLQNGQEL